MSNPRLLLASTSAYRREILQRLQYPFEQLAPDVDETPLANELPQQLAQRLATAKALDVHEKCPDAIIIGGDQVACVANTIVGKPGERETARQQLRNASAQTVIFYSALAVVTPSSEIFETMDTTEVRFRNLSDEEIETYLDKESALDCAGSFKSEGLGITLCSSISSQDPTGLIGMPLIALAQLLRQAGIQLP